MGADSFKWSDFDEYLCPSHLPSYPVVATIDRITVEEVFNPYRKRKMACPVLRLVSSEPIIGQKPLPLSASRRKSIARLFGNNPADAIGKAIGLRVVKSNQGNDMIQITEAVMDKGPNYESVPGQDTPPTETNGLPKISGKAAKLLADWKKSCRNRLETVDLLRLARANGFGADELNELTFDAFQAAIEKAAQKQEAGND